MCVYLHRYIYNSLVSRYCLSHKLSAKHPRRMFTRKNLEIYTTGIEGSKKRPQQNCKQLEQQEPELVYDRTLRASSTSFASEVGRLRHREKGTPTVKSPTLAAPLRAALPRPGSETTCTISLSSAYFTCTNDTSGYPSPVLLCRTSRSFLSYPVSENEHQPEMHDPGGQ